MSNEDFRRELNRAIDDITGAPSPALSQRVRSAVAEHGRERSSGPFWIAGVAAAAIALLFIGVLVLGNPLNHRQSTAGGTHASPTPTAPSSATPVTSPSPGFVCSISATGFSKPGAPLTAYVDAMRTGAHEPGYDRLTVEFSNGEPATIQVQGQIGTAFTRSPSGQPVTLKGKNGILVTIHGADMHTQYSGPRNVVTSYHNLVEVQVVQDFEGTVQIALGLSMDTQPCFQVQWLDNPGRLVIDVQAG